MHIGKYKIFNLLDEGLLFAFLASFGLPRRGGILQEVAQTVLPSCISFAAFNILSLPLPFLPFNYIC